MTGKTSRSRAAVSRMSHDDSQTGPETIDHAPQAGADAEMPTAENASQCVFVPGRGCSILDVFEISLMYLLQLTGNQITFAPGTLRSVPMDATRVAMLSGTAKQWMQDTQPGAL